MGGFNISGQTHALPAEAEKAKNQNVFAGAPPPSGPNFSWLDKKCKVQKM